MTFITLLSDYGSTSEFVGVMHGVIARLCPQACVIDIAHGVPRHAVEIGARVLARSLAFMPVGIHVAVVDPGVGARGAAVALRVGAEERVLVGPDNGVLMPAAERLGGVVQALDISRSPWRLERPGAIFYGRDVFAPVAARLAAGAPLEQAGAPLDSGGLRRLDLSRARRDREGNLIARVVGVDRFGNVALDAGAHDIAQIGCSPGQRVLLMVRDHRHRVVLGRAFADARPGEVLLYEDPAGMLALAVTGGSAQNVLGVRLGEPVTLAP